MVNKNVVASNKPIAPIELNDKIPRSLSMLVMECCRDNPDDRPATMNQVVARLATVRKVWEKYRELVRDKRADAPAPSVLDGNAPKIEEDS